MPIKEVIKELNDYSEGPTSHWEPICSRAAGLLTELMEEVCNLHNPHTGEECNCPICKEVLSE